MGRSVSWSRHRPSPRSSEALSGLGASPSGRGHGSSPGCPGGWRFQQKCTRVSSPMRISSVRIPSVDA
eukprot:272462-Pyramimonas_sp.AAC.1